MSSVENETGAKEKEVKYGSGQKLSGTVGSFWRDIPKNRCL